MTTKEAGIANIVAKRRSTSPPKGCYAVDHYYQGAYDQHDFVVPWTIGACNYNAKLMIIGQDWCSDAALNKPKEAQRYLIEHGQDPDLNTNKRLAHYLKNLGVPFKKCWATDAFVWIKSGNMSGGLSQRLITESARLFTLEEIKVIKPTVAVALGLKTFTALYQAENNETRAFYRMADTQPFRCHKTIIMPVYHTGWWSERTSDSVRDGYWAKVKEELSRRR